MNYNGTDNADKFLNSTGNDVYDARKGNDIIKDYAGDDVYVFNLGDGQDAITDNAGTDTIRFGAGITKNSLGFVRDGNHLTIKINGTTDSVSVIDYFAQAKYKVEGIQFADGTTLSSSDIETIMNGGTVTPPPVDPPPVNPGITPTITGTDNNDKIANGVGDDIYYAKKGSDVIKDYWGNDTYLFNLGDGQDAITDNAGTDTIRFGAGITKNSLSFVRDGNHLTVKVNGTTDSVSVIDYFTQAKYKVESIQFADGTVLSSAEVESILNGGPVTPPPVDPPVTPPVNPGITPTITGTDNNDKIANGVGDDIYYAKKGSDVIKDYWGNDTYLFNLGDGQDAITDNAGTDTIRFGAGITKNSLSFVRDGNHLTVKVNGTTDSVSVIDYFTQAKYKVESIQFADGTALSSADVESILNGGPVTPPPVDPPVNPTDPNITGTAQADTLTGTSANNTFWGKAGNDTITDPSGNDTYQFNLGDGQDSITDLAGQDILKFGNGITKDTLAFDRNNNDLNIRVQDTNDNILIKDWFANPVNQVESIQFANGTSFTAAEATQLATNTDGRVINGTDGADQLTGTNKNDVLYGGKGNDTLYGGLGADTLVGGEGDDTYYVDNADDVVNESSGVPAPPDASWITSSDLRDLYTRTYPRIMGNQWNVTAEGYFMTSEVESNVNGVKTVNWEATNAAQEKIEDFVAKYLDYITLNRVGVFDGTNGYGDLFLDNYDSVMNPEKGLLKINNELKAEANELGRKFYVMPYLNLTDVWNYESVNVNPGWNFWHSQQNYNGQDFGTWDFANDNDLFLKKNGEVLHYYGGGNDTRPIFDPNNWKWQQYYIQHIKGILDQGFDGIFSDNWWRSKYMGDLSKLNAEEFAKVQDGWSNIGNLIQDALGADKVFIGNSPVYPKYNSRDVVMLEDRIDDVLGTADKSIASYFRYSAQARDANQVCQDSYWNESLGPFETFRLPIVLMTDNILGIGAASNVGTPLDAIMTPIKTIDEIGYALGDKQIVSGTATGAKDILQDGYEVERGVYVRYYTYGVTYLNDTEARQTVTLPTGKWLRSDGKEFSGGDSITLDSCRGWVFRKADGIPLAQNQGTDTVVSSISYTLGSNLENLTLSGTANISATGNELNNVLTGNTGNNLMAGLSGNDTYLFKQGFGTDVINEVAGQDSVKFDYDIGIDNITFSKINNALKISVNGTNNSVTVNDWFVDLRYQTENVLLGESTITNSQINTALQNSGGTSVKASSLFV